jgi:transcriptional regulator
MYLPARFRADDPRVLDQLVARDAFATLVTVVDDEPFVSHVPIALVRDGERVVLKGHLAKANPHSRTAHGRRALAILHGPHAHISATWDERPESNVPTWNYEVVHAHGRVRIHDDERYVRGVVARLTREHEAGEPRPWKMSDAPAEYLAEHLAHIVGIEIELTRLEGKRKLGQNREQRDFDGAVRALDERGDVELASAMKRSGP